MDPETVRLHESPARPIARIRRPKKKVFGAQRDPRELYGVRVTLDGRYLAVYTFGTPHTRIFICGLDDPDGTFDPNGAFTCITEGVEARSTIVWHDGYFYSRTNLDAPNWRILRSRDVRPLSQWEEVVPEGEHALAGMSLIRDRFFVRQLRHACTSLEILALDGSDGLPGGLLHHGRLRQPRRSHACHEDDGRHAASHLVRASRALLDALRIGACGRVP